MIHHELMTKEMADEYLEASRLLARRFVPQKNHRPPVSSE